MFESISEYNKASFPNNFFVFNILFSFISWGVIIQLTLSISSIISAAIFSSFSHEEPKITHGDLISKINFGSTSLKLSNLVSPEYLKLENSFSFNISLDELSVVNIKLMD